MGCHYSTIKTYLSCLANFCRDNNYQDVTKTNEIRDYMKGLKRTMQGCTSPYSVDAITPEILDNIAKNKKNQNFYDARDMAAFCIQFEGLLRISEIVNLTCKDILIDDEKLAIQITRTKTDQFGEGRQILIYKSNSKHSAYF